MCSILTLILTPRQTCVTVNYASSEVQRGGLMGVAGFLGVYHVLVSKPATS